MRPLLAVLAANHRFNSWGRSIYRRSQGCMLHNPLLLYDFASWISVYKMYCISIHNPHNQPALYQNVAYNSNSNDLCCCCIHYTTASWLGMNYQKQWIIWPTTIPWHLSYNDDQIVEFLDWAQGQSGQIAVMVAWWQEWEGRKSYVPGFVLIRMSDQPQILQKRKSTCCVSNTKNQNTAIKGWK